MSGPDRPSSGALKRAKRDVRRAVLAERDSLTEAERTARAEAITRRFLELPEVMEAGSILAFWSFGSEVPMSPLIEALHDRGVRVSLPRIVGGDLEPRAYAPGDRLTATAFGAMEPAAARPVDPADLDVIATPAVAFDRTGARVGYGGGFYDRFFLTTRTACLRAGVAFDLQLCPADRALPAGSFDLKVDAIVTESETLRCAARRETPT